MPAMESNDRNRAIECSCKVFSLKFCDFLRLQNFIHVGPLSKGQS